MDCPEMKHPTYDSRPFYQVYLLRLWREPLDDDTSPPVWRFSLEDSVTHQRRGFESLEALTAFLEIRLRKS
jgi:hypothetical protein